MFIILENMVCRLTSKNENIIRTGPKAGTNAEFACTLSEINLRTFVKAKNKEIKHHNNSTIGHRLKILFGKKPTYSRYNENEKKIMERRNYYRNHRSNILGKDNRKIIKNNIKVINKNISNNILNNLEYNDLFILKKIIKKYSEIIKYMVENIIPFTKESEPHLYHTIESLKIYEAQKQYTELKQLISTFKSDRNFLKLRDRYLKFKNSIMERYVTMMRKLIEKYWKPTTTGNKLQDTVLQLHDDYTLLATEYIGNRIILSTDPQYTTMKKSSSQINFSCILVFNDMKLADLDSVLVSIYIINNSWWRTNNIRHYEF